MSEPLYTTFDIERPRQTFDLAAVSRELLVKTGSGRFFIEWAKLNAGKSRMLFDEYLAMRLWDSAFCPRPSLGEFVGNRGMEKIWNTANFIPGIQALASNKIAASALLEAYGLAVAPFTGLHALGVVSGPDRTSTPEALEKFLLQNLSYPAFGKPLTGTQSLGSVSFESCERSSGTLLRQDGSRIKADIFAREIHDYYAKNGYIFQPKLVPDKTSRSVCGERTATLRILTLNVSGGPKIFRACWKIPAGPNWADNFWRPGNLLASVDLDTGIVQRVVTGTGLAMKEVEHHPDTQARLTGMKVPLWEERCTAAIKGAAVLSDFGLLGWDIAATSEGPIIVDVNDTPDAIICQIADRRGIMEPQLHQFLEERRQALKAWKIEQGKKNRKEYASAGKIFWPK